MTKAEAIKMLDEAPQGEGPSRLNPVFSQKESVEIIRAMVESPQCPDPLRALHEKRVWQVFKNQRRPRY